MPAGTRRDAAGEGDALERRLAALEEAVATMATEIRTRRLVVSAGRDAPRVVAEVARSTAELRLELPAGRDGPPAAAVLFATASREPAGTGCSGGAGDVAPHGSAQDADPRDADLDDVGLGPGVGLQLWAEGDAVAELDAWPDAAARWRPQLHLDG
jgi:hypothetical protein